VPTQSRAALPIALHRSGPAGARALADLALAPSLVLRNCPGAFLQPSGARHLVVGPSFVWLIGTHCGASWADSEPARAYRDAPSIRVRPQRCRPG